VGVRLFTRLLSASLGPYFPTTIYLVVVHSQYSPGCLLPMHRPTNGDAAGHRQFFRVQFTFHFDALTISKIGNYPTRLTDCVIRHFTSYLLIIFDLDCKSIISYEMLKSIVKIPLF